MRLSRDFNEFIQLSGEHKVRFLVVGGYALAVHGHPRFTKDLDVWILADLDNASRLLRALGVLPPQTDLVLTSITSIIEVR